MSRYAVALGSNLGDRLGYLRQGVEGLRQLGRIAAISGLYETEPVGGPEQGPYLNAVVLLHCDAGPHDLLNSLHAIEEEAGRKRSVRWGERTLDLDVVAWDGAPVRTAELVIPHPRAPERRFVLAPLADVWPEARLGDSLSAIRALEEAPGERVDLLAANWADSNGIQPGKYWVLGQFVLFLAIAIAMALDGSLPEGQAEVTRIAGGALTVLGGLLAFLSMRRLGDSLTALPEPLAGADLVESGPYALARHPIYGGVSLFLLGTSLFLDSITGAVLSVGLLIFFWFKSSYEERQLRIAYPEYQVYQQRVTRRLIPFLL